jgi:DNA mismatch repair protein MutL
MSITVLSEDTINKIAAGEVVERPANVVKELVENSLDAAAAAITLEIKGAGRQLIRISDNGIGMNRDDLTLAVTRHATAKITSFSDIVHLNTMGFRGEALPSIAAVSHCSILSQPRDGSGWQIHLDGGKPRESKAWSGAPGTIVEIHDLFFNTPARAKFLKSDQTERSRILSLIEEIALVRHTTAFTVITDGKPVINAPRAATRVERIRDILGREFEQTLIATEATHPRLKLTAFITPTDHSLPNRSSQFFFVNDRPITPSRSLQHAVYEACRENLPVGRHPGILLFLNVDPSDIDVNIHPTKREVRFAHEQEVHSFVMQALRSALIRPINILLSETPPPSQPTKSVQYHSVSAATPTAVREMHNSYRTQSSSPTVQQSLSTAESSSEDDNIEILGQSKDMYIIARRNDDLLIIDQHAAAERIRYEKYLAEWRAHYIPVQPMLLPFTMELVSSKLTLLKDNLALIQEAGLDVEEFGGTTIRITAIPAVLTTNSEIATIIEKIVDALAEGEKLPRAEKIETIIRAACRSSIKAGDTLHLNEMKALIRDLFHCNAPYTCPHGRPTLLRLSHNDLQKHFGRI